MKINLLGIDVNYKLEDTGKRKFLFIHGYESSMEFIKGLYDENRNYDIVAIELPGFGTSEFNQEVSVEFFAEIVEEFINELDLKDLTLVGHSLGGAVATIVSKNERVKKAILLNPLNPYTYSEVKKNIKPSTVIEQLKNTRSRAGINKSTSLLKLVMNYKNRNKYLVNKQFLSNDWQGNYLYNKYQENRNKLVIISSRLDKIVLPSSVDKTCDAFGIEKYEIKDLGHSPINKKPDLVNNLLNLI